MEAFARGRLETIHNGRAPALSVHLLATADVSRLRARPRTIEDGRLALVRGRFRRRDEAAGLSSRRTRRKREAPWNDARPDTEGEAQIGSMREGFVLCPLTPGVRLREIAALARTECACRCHHVPGERRPASTRVGHSSKRPWCLSLTGCDEMRGRGFDRHPSRSRVQPDHCMRSWSYCLGFSV